MSWLQHWQIRVSEGGFEPPSPVKGLGPQLAEAPWPDLRRFKKRSSEDVSLVSLVAGDWPVAEVCVQGVSSGVSSLPWKRGISEPSRKRVGLMDRSSRPVHLVACFEGERARVLEPGRCPIRLGAPTAHDERSSGLTDPGWSGRQTPRRVTDEAGPPRARLSPHQFLLLRDPSLVVE